MTEFIPIRKAIDRAYGMWQASVIGKNNNSDDKNKKEHADVFHKKTGRADNPTRKVIMLISYPKQLFSSLGKPVSQKSISLHNLPPGQKKKLFDLE